MAEALAGWRERQHALRQPLNALGLYAAALQARPLPPDQQPLVRGIVESLAALEAQLDQWATELTRADSQARVASRPGGEDTPAAGIASPAESSAKPGLSAPMLAPQGEAPVSPSTVPTVLVIDDDPASRMSMSLLLEAWGAQVVEFDGLASLEAALEAPLGPPPHVVIVDYHLGAAGDTGPQALQRLRSAWPGHSFPALLITGDEAVARAVTDHRGRLTVLRKPVAPVVLLEAVELLVEGVVIDPA